MNARYIKFQVEKRDGPKCFLKAPGCLKNASDLHHIVARSCPFNELWSMKNLVILCRSCHDKAQSAEVRAFLLNRLSEMYGYDYSSSSVFQAALVPL